MKRYMLLLVTAFILVAAFAVAQEGYTHLTSLALSEDLSVGDDATVTDDASIGGDLTVTGAFTLAGAIAMNGGATVPDDTTICWGAAPDGCIEYDENGTDQMRSTGPWIWTGAQEFDAAVNLDYDSNVGDDVAVGWGDSNEFSLEYDEDSTDNLQLTIAAATDSFQVLAGNVEIGDGTPDQTIDGEDLYCEGLFELDGVFYSDGGALIADDITICWGGDSDVCLEYDEDGTDQGRLTGAMIYEDAQEYDSTAQFDDVATFTAQPVFNVGSKVLDDQHAVFGTEDDAYIAWFDSENGLGIIADSVAMSGDLSFGDDQLIYLGEDSDGSIEYDEDGTDQIRTTGPWIWEGAQEYDAAVSFDDAVDIADDIAMSFGDGLDFSISYDETTDDRAEFVGPMAFDSGAGVSIPIETATGAHQTITVPVGYLSATEFQTAPPFSAFTSAGIEGGGQAETGAAEGFIELGDAADALRLGLTIPETAITGTTAADFILTFDMIENTDEECNLDVVIYEYGNTTPVISDTIVMANGAARAWVGLTTLATGQGAVLDPGKFYLIEITATADTDDFKIYGARATFLRGFQNNAT